jgi:hypothetical protein
MAMVLADFCTEKANGEDARPVGVRHKTEGRITRRREGKLR